MMGCSRLTVLLTKPHFRSSSIQSSDDSNEKDLKAHYTHQSQSGDLSLLEVKPVSLNVRDLNLTVTKSTVSKLSPLNWFSKKLAKSSGDVEKGEGPEASSSFKKHILQSISLDVPSGSVMAIIGGSGSGKTSLLNVLADRISSSNLDLTGNVLYNSSPGLKHVQSSFVLQQDIYSPN